MLPVLRSQRAFRFPPLAGICILGALALAIPGGCQPAAAPAPSQAAAAPPPAEQPAPAEAAEGTTDIWDAFFLQGAKIGYAHTTVRPVERQGQQLVEVRSLNHLAVERFGQKAEQQMELITLENPAGAMLEFVTEIKSAGSRVKVSGRVEGLQLVMETDSKGRRETTRMPWSDAIGGFRAVEQSLERAPLKPGETRSIKMLMPLVNQVADVELSARQEETTAVLGVETRLLRVESVARLPGGQAMNSTLWVDGQGQAIKTLIAAFQQESFRTSRELALAASSGPAKFDLGSDLIVKPDRPLPKPYETREVRYRIELADGDPVRSFANGGTQSVKSLGPHAAEVTVRALKPGGPLPMHAAPTPDGRYLAANSVLQVDDPRIQQMAAEARGDATRPADVALKLERYVHDVMTTKGFSQAFSTAAEVAESHEGDCTEHAVLLAALARACQLPSRVAIGLVYVESAGGFGYHMWTEVYLDGQWVPLDGIMGRGGTNAAYLKLTDSSLEGASAYGSFLPVAQVVGQLKIGILESKP